MMNALPPQLTELPATSYAAAGALCARAYQNDAAVLAVLGHLTPAERLKTLSAYWELHIRFTARHGTALCIHTAGNLAGIKLFYTHKHYPPPALAKLLLSMRVAARLIPVLGLNGFLQHYRITKALGRKHPKEPHFYSELTCVDPVFQRRGFYSLLKKEMIRQADAAGASIYGETSNPLSAQLIQKFGFHVIGEENIGGIDYLFLHRNKNGKIFPTSF